MFNWKEFEKTKALLAQSDSYQDLSGQHHITIRPVQMIEWIEMISNDLNFSTLVEMAGVDLSLSADPSFQFDLSYHFLNMGTHQRLNIHVLFNETEIIPSIVNFFPNADWMEREQSEALGINFSRVLKSLLYPQNNSVYPLRKKNIHKSWAQYISEPLPKIRRNPNKSEAPFPEESYVWKEYSIFSPLSKGMFEWRLCTDHAKVVNSEVSIGFHHQGFEKLLETKDWIQVLHLVDKILLGGAPTYSIAWAQTIENRLRLKLPERAQAIRIITLELARIAEHLTVMYEMTFALKMDEHRLFINAREKIYELMEKYCGRRQGHGFVSFGGLKEDLPNGWIVEYQTISEIVLKNLRNIQYSLIGKPKFKDSLNQGAINSRLALEWGISGPSMRASGLNFDLRKSQPFYFYQDIDFDIPVGIHGTAYERFLIRYEEIIQSFRIITQVIDNLPLGNIMNSDFDKDYQSVIALLSGAEFSKGWQYNSIESPNGEAGFYVMLKGNNAFPYRVKIKTPSFSLMQALPFFIKGIDEDLVGPYLASLGIRTFELDR